MLDALGMVELATVSSGVSAADRLLKTAAVTLIEARILCPGRYIALFHGELGAACAARDAVLQAFSDKLLDWMVLGNPAQGLFPALAGTVVAPATGALGILETSTAASALVVADAAAKAAQVTLLRVRLARELCGKSVVTLTGAVADVQMAVESAQRSLTCNSALVDSAVLPNPDSSLFTFQ